MLSVKKISSSSEAGKYYQKADYYTKGEGQTDIQSNWHGEAAENLGLVGAVEHEKFVNILDGKLPNGQSLERNTGDRVPGWDLTFSAPKSVSLMALIGDDKRLLTAHLDAVKSTLNFLEKEYLVNRVMRNGESKFENTEAMLSALFTHTTSRTLDPQLHTHSVITNATVDEKGNYRAIESSPIYKNKMLLGQVYRSELANTIKKLGYQIDWNKQKGTFEIIGVEKEHIDTFSKRRKQITEYAKDKDLSGGKDMDRAALATRDSKKDRTTREVTENWDKEAEKINFDHQSIKNEAIAKSLLTNDNDHGVEDIVRFAYRNLSYNEAVFTRQDLLKEALLFAHGEKSLSSIDKVIDKFAASNELILAKQKSQYGKNTVAYTTSKAIELEMHTLKLLAHGIGEVGPLGSKEQYNEFEKEFNKTEKYPLMAEQSNAVKNLVFNKDRFSVLQGFAGVGKSFSLKAFKLFAEQRGFNITGYAPTGQASQNLFESAGIKSNTIDSLLERLNKTEEIPNLTGDIWVVDESGMANARQMNQLVDFATKTNARIRFVGDKKQLSGVEWGKSFEQAQTSALDTFTMSNIVRQNKDKYPELYDAVIHSMNGNPRQAFSSLKLSKSENTGVKQLSPKKAIESSSNHYVELIAKSLQNGNSIDEAITRDTKLLILTNKDRRSANDLVRKGLQEKNIIGQDQIETNAFINLQLKPEEKADIYSYKKGLIVRFLSENKSLNTKENSYYSIDSINKSTGNINLKSKTGEEVIWNPKKDGANKDYGVTIYEPLKTSLAKGDFIRWRDKNEEAGLKNADVGKIIKIENDNITMTLKSGEVINFNVNDERYKHFEYEYAATLYSAQGDTYRNVVGYLNDSNKYLLNQKALYVGVSRAENNAMFYVTNEDKVSKLIENNDGGKTSALEGIGYKYDGSKDTKSSLLHTVPILNNLDEAVINAASELISYDSVFSRNDLIKLVYINTKTSFEVENINNSIDRLTESKKLIPAKLNGSKTTLGAFTTNEAIVKEWRMSTYVERGINKYDPIISEKENSYTSKNPDIDTKNAIDLTLTNQDRFININSNDRESSLNYIQTINEISEQRGHNIRGLTLSGKEAIQITKDTGMPSQTISSFMYRMDRIEKLPEYKNEIWLVDQSQMIAKNDIEKLISLADKTNARIIFNSQENAIESIQSGGAIKQLSDLGMKSASITNNKNQDEILLNNINNSTEEKDKEKRLDLVSNIIVKNIKEEGFLALVPSKQDRALVNSIVRSKLQNKEHISKEEMFFKTLENSNLNPHQQAISLNYTKGMFLQLSSDDKELNLEKNKYYEVKSSALGAIKINVNGKEVSISDKRLKEHSALGLQVKKESKIALSNGDIIRNRVNDKKSNIKNGDILEVLNTTKEGITAKNKKGDIVFLDQNNMNARHIEYAYSSGIHGSIGMKHNSGVLLLESYRKNLVTKRAINTVISSISGNITTILDNKNKLLSSLKDNNTDKQSALKGIGILSKLKGQEDFSNLNQHENNQNISEIIKNSVSHLYEKESVFSRSALVQTAIKSSNAPLIDINNHIDELLKKGELIQAKIDLDGKTHSAMITTKSAVKRERYIQDLFKSGKNSYKPFAKTKDIRKISETFGLNERQESVLENVMTSRDQFVGMEGRHTKELYESLQSIKQIGMNKAQVKLFSPRAQLAEQITERTGLETKSIQGHILGLSNNAFIKHTPNALWVITDSHMLSTHEIADTMTLARRSGSKVIFHHDEKAAAAMGQGQNLNVLKDGGFQTYSINSPDTRKMKLLGKTYNDEESLLSTKAVNKFESIIEIPDKEQRDQKMVNDYLSVDDKHKSNYMLVVATEHDRKNITDKIRKALRLQGKIAEDETKITTYSRIPLSKVQRMQAQNYDKGNVVKFERGVKSQGIQPGEYLEIVEKKDQYLVLQSSTGEKFNWHPEKVAAASSRGIHIFKTNKISLSKGDKIRYTETNRKNEIQKGREVNVINIEGNLVTILNHKKEIKTLDLNNPEHRHLAHNYAETYISAQSAKNAHIIMGQVESFQKRLLSQRNLYTVMNKAQHKFIGYVDNKNEINRHLEKKSGTKLNAIDIQKKSKSNVLTKPKTNDINKNKPKIKEKVFRFVKGFGGPSM